MTSPAPGAASGDSPAPSRPGPSLASVRARRLLAGGLAGAHLTASLCLAVFGFRDGLAGLATAALSAALVVLFYTVGQWVQVRVADAPARTIFLTSVASYVARVSVLGVLLVAYLRLADGTSQLLAVPMVITAVATVVGWLTGEVIVFSRLRILNFDEPIQVDERGQEGLEK